MVYGTSPNQEPTSGDTSSSPAKNPLTGKPFESFEEFKAYGRHLTEVMELKRSLESVTQKSKLKISLLLVLLFLSLVTNCVLALCLAM